MVIFVQLSQVNKLITMNGCECICNKFLKDVERIQWTAQTNFKFLTDLWYEKR